jgi:mannose-1-phosphate guanylyltransferase
LKAFLLAAGHGSRLRPLTNRIPKCLVPIRGVPLLQIWLQLCARFGISDILINVHTHVDMVREFIRKHPNGGRIKLAEEPELLGSAGTLLANREWVASEPLFWVFYADVLTRANLAAMLRMHQSRKPAATLGVYRVPDPSRCGIVTVAEDMTIQGFVEKPRDPPSNLAFAGLLIGTEELLEIIPRRQPVDMGFDVLPQLVDRMLAYPVSDYLIDIGTIENYQKAQATWPDLPADS